MKTILLANDGSEPALHAAEFLAQLPHDEAIELIVVSVLYMPGSEKAFLVGDWIETRLAQQRRNTDLAYAKIKNMFAGDNVSLSQLVCEGHPAETLIAMARELRAELMVIGATGHSAITRKLLGSTSDYIVNHAPCSVLVARPTQSIGSKQPLRVAIEFEKADPAQGGLEGLTEFVCGTNPEIHRVAVFSVNRDSAPAGLAGMQDRFQKATHPHCDTERVVQPQFVLAGHVGKGLVRYATEHDCDIFVVGESPRKRGSGKSIGSKTKFVLRHAPCSVLINRNRVIRGLKRKKKAKSKVKSKATL